MIAVKSVFASLAVHELQSRENKQCSNRAKPKRKITVGSQAAAGVAGRVEEEDWHGK